MARYRVQGPDGKIHVFEGPDGAAPADVEAFAAQTFGGNKPAAKPPADNIGAMDDPGALMAALIGAGRTTDRVIKGMQQLYYGATGAGDKQAALKDLAEGDDAAYKPLEAQHPMATAVGESAPSLVVPVGGAASLAGNAARLALAGGVPGALEYGTAGERAGRAAGGAAAGAVGGIVAPKLIEAGVKAVPAIGRTAKAIAEPLYQGGREAIAGRALNTAAGDSAPAVIGRLNSAAPIVPGSMPTVGQVAESGGLAALERSAAARAPEDFAKRGMDQASARLQALRGIAGDDASMAAAVASRKATTAPLYRSAADQVVTTADPRLQELLQRPSVQQAISRAANIAKEEGRQFGLAPSTGAVPGMQIVDEAGNVLLDLGTKAQPGKITGRTLQDIKMGLDALLKDPTSGIAGKEAANVAATRGQLMNWMENAIPELRVARSTYAGMSKPINQMQIGQQLMNKLEPALNDFGALGKETGAKYALALRNADQTARTATKFKGAGMADIMRPDQMATLEAIGADLARKANAQDLGRGVGSDTFQKLAMDNIAARSGAPRVVGGAMNLPGVSKVAKFLYSGPEEQIQSLIAKSLLDPKMAAGLMARSPAMPPGRTTAQMLLANPGRAAQIGSGTAGLALGNLFAQ